MLCFSLRLVPCLTIRFGTSDSACVLTLYHFVHLINSHIIIIIIIALHNGFILYCIAVLWTVSQNWLFIVFYLIVVCCVQCAACYVIWFFLLKDTTVSYRNRNKHIIMIMMVRARALSL